MRPVWGRIADTRSRMHIFKFIQLVLDRTFWKPDAVVLDGEFGEATLQVTDNATVMTDDTD